MLASQADGTTGYRAGVGRATRRPDTREVPAGGALRRLPERPVVYRKSLAWNTTSSEFTGNRLLPRVIVATATGGVWQKIRCRVGLLRDGRLRPEHTWGKRTSQTNECAHSRFRCLGLCGLMWMMKADPLGVGPAASAAWGWCGSHADPGLLLFRVHRGGCPQLHPIGSMSSSLVSSSLRGTYHLWPAGNGAGPVDSQAVVHVEVAILAQSRSVLRQVANPGQHCSNTEVLPQQRYQLGRGSRGNMAYVTGGTAGSSFTDPWILLALRYSTQPLEASNICKPECRSRWYH